MARHGLELLGQSVTAAADGETGRHLSDPAATDMLNALTALKAGSPQDRAGS
jgi:hypothetical protein